MARFLKDRTKSQGAAPGSLIFIGKQKMTKNSIHVIQYTPEGVKESFPETVDGISNMVSNDHMTWINISGLQNTGLIAEIGKAFDISSLFLEDILNTDQRPRFSDESDHLYIIAKSFYLGKEDDVVHMEQLSFIVGSHYLITVQETDADYFKDVRKNLIHDFNLNANIPIDPKVLTFQIPGGMLSNLLNQMKEMGVADKYPQLLEEMPRVRAELGYPPLVTPTSQIVGSMSVLNVALGRYKMIPREVKDLILGKYGRTPGPIDPEVKRLAIGDAPQIDHRPADDIPPQMKKLREKLAEEGFPNAPIEDVLSYASFPEVTLNFLRHSNIGMKFHDL